MILFSTSSFFFAWQEKAWLVFQVKQTSKYETFSSYSELNFFVCFRFKFSVNRVNQWNNLGHSVNNLFHSKKQNMKYEKKRKKDLGVVLFIFYLYVPTACDGSIGCWVCRFGCCCKVIEVSCLPIRSWTWMNISKYQKYQICWFVPPCILLRNDQYKSIRL